MRHPLSLIQRFLLLFYSPKRIARLLSSKSPAEAAFVLRSFNVNKCQTVVSYWAPTVQVVIVREMGDYGLRLVKLMDLEQQSFFLVKLPAKMVRKLADEIPKKDLERMMGMWSEDEQQAVLSKLPGKLAATLLAKMPLERQIIVLRLLKPWIAAPMMADLDSQSRASVLEGMEFRVALDLFDRWPVSMKSEVLSLIKQEVREAIAYSIRPHTLAAILDHWSAEEAVEVILTLPEDQQLALLRDLPQEFTFQVFPQLPAERQRIILNSSKPDVASKLLSSFSKEETEKLLVHLHPEHASTIRRLILMGQGAS